MKVFADDKINVTEKLKFVLVQVENIVGKGENAGYQHFLLFPQCFEKSFFPRSGLRGKELNVHYVFKSYFEVWLKHGLFGIKIHISWLRVKIFMYRKVLYCS